MRAVDEAAPDSTTDTAEARPSLTGFAVGDRSPLFLDGWLEFNRRLSGVEPVRIRTEVRGTRGVEAVIYVDRRGRVVLPPLNPYLPIAYEAPVYNQPIRERRHWIDAVAPLVDEMRSRRVADNVVLSPGIDDVRPWFWAGFRSTMSYTTVVRIPAAMSRMDREMVRRARKSAEIGYRLEVGAPAGDVVECMAGTERRKGFSHHFLPEDASLLASLLGADAARAYVIYAPDGSPASSVMVLHNPGGVAVSTVGGTDPRFFADGVSQLLAIGVLEDLTHAGAIAWDMAGADIQGVALWKEGLGGELTVVPRIEPRTLRNVLRGARDWAFRSRGSENPSGSSGTPKRTLRHQD